MVVLVAIAFVDFVNRSMDIIIYLYYVLFNGENVTIKSIS
jgi:hypothetical protein